MVDRMMRRTLPVLAALLLAAPIALAQTTAEAEARTRVIKQFAGGHNTFSGLTPGSGGVAGGGFQTGMIGGVAGGGFQTGMIGGTGPSLNFRGGTPGIGVGLPPHPVPPPVLVLPLPKIDPKATLKDLLPAAPELKKVPVYLGDDLRRVPEVRFEDRPGKELSHEEWFKRRGHAVAAALHLNARDEDGYIKALVKSRPDLGGLPLAMGDDCRTKGPFNASFKGMVDTVRPMLASSDQLTANFVLTRRNAAAIEDREKAEAPILAHLAAVRQMAGPAEGDAAVAVVQYLATVQRAEATRDLARIAVFSRSAAARKQAVEALAVRRERDYTPVLLDALRYPWPAVAANAAEAITRLERADLMPKLVDMLEAPDPRGPSEEGEGEKKAYSSRELVRINHHHNCLLCHAPAERGKVADDVLIAETPLPSQSLQPPTTGYGSTKSPLLVRIDVTYIRQDFSVMQEVTDEKTAWPTAQRFDFVVRKRELTKDEADELKKKLEEREPGVLSPYQKAAVKALREMTGRDFEPKAEAWRKFLKLKGA